MKSNLIIKESNFSFNSAGIGGLLYMSGNIDLTLINSAFYISTATSSANLIYF